MCSLIPIRALASGAHLERGRVGAITAFLHSLTGEQAQVTYPTLPPSALDTPRPE